MKTWDEFISWLDRFPKINSLFVDGEEGIEAVPFGAVGDSEEEAKQKMIEGITELIDKSETVWVRWMPEVHHLTNVDGSPTGKYKGYMRIAYREKVTP